MVGYITEFRFSNGLYPTPFYVKRGYEKYFLLYQLVWSSITFKKGQMGPAFEWCNIRMVSFGLKLTI
jgi:hypothetical protein